MNKLTSIGKGLIESLGISQEQITKERVFDIISIQDRISPYSIIETRQMRWKIQGKKREGGHLNIQRFREKFSPLEK